MTRSDLESWSALLFGPRCKGRSEKNTPHPHCRVCADCYSVKVFSGRFQEIFCFILFYICHLLDV